MLAPHTDLVHGIALTAWGRIDRLDKHDEDRTTDFIERLRKPLFARLGDEHGLSLTERQRALELRSVSASSMARWKVGYA